MYSRFEISGKSKLGLLGLIALIFFGFHVYAFIQSQASSKWPKTQGRISRSDIETRRSHRRRGWGGYSRRAIVKYRYTARGKSYTNDRIRFTDGPSLIRISQWSPQAITQKYPVGKKVTVKFDPDDPSDSVLETALPISSYVWMSVCTVVMAVSGMCFCSDGTEKIGL